MNIFIDLLKRFKIWIISITALLVSTGGFFTALGEIKDSEFRPVIKYELDSEKVDILKIVRIENEKVLKIVEGNTIKLAENDLNSVEKDLLIQRQQYYEVWKDEKKYGPVPEVVKRKKELESSIERLEEQQKSIKKYLKDKRGN